MSFDSWFLGSPLGSPDLVMSPVDFLLGFAIYALFVAVLSFVVFYLRKQEGKEDD